MEKKVGLVVEKIDFLHERFLDQSYEFHSQIKGSPYSIDSNVILEFEGFDHKMFKLHSFINFSCSEIALIWRGERKI